MNKLARGRPRKKESDKLLSNGLRVDQWNFICGRAKAQNIPAASLQRLIIDWYIAASRSGDARSIRKMKGNKVNAPDVKQRATHLSPQ